MNLVPRSIYHWSEFFKIFFLILQENYATLFHFLEPRSMEKTVKLAHPRCLGTSILTPFEASALLLFLI